MKIKRKVLRKLLDDLMTIQDGLGLAVDDAEGLSEVEVMNIEQAVVQHETDLEKLHDELGGVIQEIVGHYDGLLED